MKLVRYGSSGGEKPGLIDAKGVMRDLSGVIADIAGDALSPQGLARLAALKVESIPVVSGRPRLGPPIAGVRNFVCIGMNYADHAAEMGTPIPKEPIVFLKSLNAICGPTDDIIVPKNSTMLDWETELAVVIGTTARCVSKETAMNHVAGYTLANDFSERAWQYDRGGTWDKGKGFDTAGPLGPWLVTTDEMPQTNNLDVFLDLDGQRMQNGNTRSMIFDVQALVSHVSEFITLHPGDIISTGTPPGVGRGRKPPQYLRPSQNMRFGITGLGEQQHRTIAAG